MRNIILLVVLLGIVSAKSWSSDLTLSSRFSSIQKCKTQNQDDSVEFKKCASMGSYNVYIEVMDLYSGLLIQDKKTKYNTVEMINEVPAGKCTVGAFTYVSGKKVEWLYSKGSLKGLIVQVTGTDILSVDQKEVSANCVIKINERRDSTILGLGENRKEALNLLKTYL